MFGERDVLGIEMECFQTVHCVLSFVQLLVELVDVYKLVLQLLKGNASHYLFDYHVA